MTEVINSTQPSLPTESLILDAHTLYLKESNIPFPVETVKQLFTSSTVETSTPSPQIEDLDRAYHERRIKYARSILERLTEHEPYFYSSGQNRIALNDLAHPMHQYLATQEYGGTVKPQLAKEIEAVYGRGSDQLLFLLTQYNEHAQADPGFLAEIEGGLSELTIFLLPARELTDEVSNPYLFIPSTDAEDRAHVTKDGIHQGYDFIAVRQSDNTRIPVQVKTSTTHRFDYPEHILMVSVADLVSDNYATPRMLAEAMYFEMTGAQNADTDLIDAASKRLFSAFDAYVAPQMTY